MFIISSYYPSILKCPFIYPLQLFHFAPSLSLHYSITFQHYTYHILLSFYNCHSNNPFLSIIILSSLLPPTPLFLNYICHIFISSLPVPHSSLLTHYNPLYFSSSSPLYYSILSLLNFRHI